MLLSTNTVHLIASFCVVAACLLLLSSHHRHGRATFSVLLFQDLAVVVLLMLIPLLAPDPSGASTGMDKIAQVGYHTGSSTLHALALCIH